MPKAQDYSKIFPVMIRVGQEDYAIRFASKLKNDDAGYCDSDMKLIVISRNQSPYEMLATLFHEALHAAEYEYNFELGHPKIRRLEYLISDIVLKFDGPLAQRQSNSRME